MRSVSDKNLAFDMESNITAASGLVVDCSLEVTDEMFLDDLAELLECDTCTLDVSSIKTNPSDTRDINKSILFKPSTSSTELKRSAKSKNSKEKSDSKAVKRFQSQRSTKQASAPKRTMLYAFPSYDRSDSLLFLPTNLTRHLNTGDLLAVRALLSKHLDPQCHISFDTRFPHMNLQTLMKVYQLMDDFQPDRIMCVSSTRVVGDTIRAHVHMKFTDSKLVHDSAVCSVSDPALQSLIHNDNVNINTNTNTNSNVNTNVNTNINTPIHTNSRENRYDTHIQSTPNLAHHTQQIMSMVHSQQNVVVYVNMELVLTVDSHSNRVTRFACPGEVSSMQLQ